MVYNKGLDIVGDYSEFAERYGLDASDVTMYADGMRKGSSAQAARALAEIGRKIIAAHEDEIHSLLDMRKFRKPVEKALKDAFGDVDKLIDERRKQVEEERNTMEASRKRADEEAAARKHRLDELSMLTSDEINNLYMEAIENGDDAVAREMLDEFARRKGYGDAESDYQGVGAWGAPSKPDYETDEARRNAVGEDSPDLNVEDMAAGYSNQPQDIFVHPEKYSQGLSTSKESGKAIQTAIDDIRSGKKDVKVKVYRAVPTTVKEDKLRNGDWVTPSKEYAEIHGNNRLDGMYRIIEDEVPASELWWDSNDVNEWGYDNGKSYRYKNVKNNRKLDDLVTRDDKGNVIPPSKRFNQRKADERYHRGVEVNNPSEAEVVLRDTVIDRLREGGMEVITDVAEGQRVLDAANGNGKFQMGDASETFAERQKKAVENRGVVMPGLNEIDVEIVKDIPKHGYSGDIAEATKQAIQKAKEKYVPYGKVTVLHYENNGAQFDYVISGNAIEACLSPKHQAKSRNKGVHLALAEHLDTIINKSVEVEEHPDYIKGTDGKRGKEINPNALMHRFYGVAIISDTPCRVMTLMREDGRSEESNGIHSYEVQKIEVLDNDLPSTSNGVGTQMDNPSAYPLAKLLKNVEKAYDNGKKLLEESKKRSDDAVLTSRKDGDVRYFRTANGEAYGFTVGGKIYVDPRIATSETPVHEYAHLWASALRACNPDEWQNVVELMKGTTVWNEVRNRYPELKSDDEIADEVIATYSGRRGAERLRAEQRKIADGNGDVIEKAESISALEMVKQALKKFWKGVVDFLHIHYTSVEKIADHVMKDLLDGIDPKKMGETKDSGLRFNAKQKRALETASLGNAPRSLTVVSSADGAKILNNIDKLARTFEKSATQPKTFIGDVAKALGASRYGSGSEYATFETKNGDIVTIRLANHNAHVSGFDYNDKDNGISIVITPKPNEGITNDGIAHITEFYYDSIKLRRAEGKPLAEIVRSIKQALYSGEFKDTTGLAERQEVNGENVLRYQFNLVKANNIDKGKGLAYLSFASRYVQQVIDKQDLNTAAKVVKDFVNPKVSDENITDEDIIFRDGGEVEAHNVQNRIGMSLNERRPHTLSIEDREAGSAMVDHLRSMGIIVSTDNQANRRVLKNASKDHSEAGKVRHFKTEQGESYGFAYKGKIHLDLRKIDAELPLHEYAHLWCASLRRINPDNWNSIIEMLKQDGDTWQFITVSYPELQNDSDIAEEVIAHYSGKRGAEKLKAELQRMTQRDGNYASRWGNIYQNISKAIQDFWKHIGDSLNFHYENKEDLADQILNDFAKEVNPLQKVEKWLKERDRKYGDYVAAGDTEKAQQLFTAALHEHVGNGITPYIVVGGYRGNMDQLARRVKTGEDTVVQMQAINEAADLMTPLISSYAPDKAVLVPAPSHSGVASDMLSLANAISERTGIEVADVLRSAPRESQYKVKKETGKPLSSVELGIRKDGDIPDGKLPIIVDNVVGSGNTAKACVDALGSGIVLAVASAVTLNRHVSSLKSAAPILYDKDQDLIPLSKRFEFKNHYTAPLDQMFVNEPIPYQEPDIIQGLESYDTKDIRAYVQNSVQEVLDIEYPEEDIYIKQITIIGSRTRGEGREDSDLDILLEYGGDDVREDDLFNVLNNEENKIMLEGIEFDINPINAKRSLNTAQWLARDARWHEEDMKIKTSYKNNTDMESKVVGQQMQTKQQELLKFYTDLKSVCENELVLLRQKSFIEAFGHDAELTSKMFSVPLYERTIGEDKVSFAMVPKDKYIDMLEDIDVDLRIVSDPIQEELLEDIRPTIVEVSNNQPQQAERPYHIVVGTDNRPGGVEGEYHVHFSQPLANVSFEDFKKLAENMGGTARMMNDEPWADFYGEEDAIKFADKAQELNVDRIAEQRDDTLSVSQIKISNWENLDYTKYIIPEGVNVENASVTRIPPKDGEKWPKFVISADVNGKHYSHDMWGNDIKAFYEKDENKKRTNRVTLDQLVAKYFGKQFADSMSIGSVQEAEHVLAEQKDDKKQAIEGQEQKQQAQVDKEKGAAERKAADEKKAQEESAKKKAEEEKKNDKKEKIPAVVLQTTLLIGALASAKEHDGKWLNRGGKLFPNFVQKGQVVSPFNALMMALHSDANGYKTNTYTTFNGARTGGYSVKGGESGLPFNWYNWDKYVNRFNSKEIISKESYEKLPAEEKELFKVLRSKEERSIFNIDQTTMPQIKVSDYNTIVEEQEKEQPRLQQSSESGETKAAVVAMTPILKQFYDLKGKHPDAVLLFRCGDFYETYSQDAEKASKILGITLTKSSHTKDADGKPLAMAGFPYHALDTYLPKLIRAGERVAICDQLDDFSQKERFGVSEIIYAKGSELVTALSKHENVVLDPYRETGYDSEKGILHFNQKRVSPMGQEVATAISRLNDTYRASVGYTGEATRLNRGGSAKLLPEDTQKYDRLVQELAAGVMMSRHGYPATLSKENMDLVPYWERELKESPVLMDLIERDVNRAVEVLDKIKNGETVDYSAIRGEKAFDAARPKLYTIASELAAIPNANTKEVVIVKDSQKKSAAVILPAGASLEVNNEVPGLNKNRFVIALRKQGFDDVQFYNAGGALGLNQSNEFFADKTVEIAKLKQYEIITIESIDLTEEIERTSKVDIEKVSITRDDKNNPLLYVKPTDGESFTVYPEPADVKTFFQAFRTQEFDSVRESLGQKYYSLVLRHPDLKRNVLMPDISEDIDLSRITKVNITKDKYKENTTIIFATIDGESQKPVELSKLQAQRFWLVDDQDMYKLAIAAQIWQEKLNVNQGQSEDGQAQFRDNHEGSVVGSGSSAVEAKASSEEEKCQEKKSGRLHL